MVLGIHVDSGVDSAFAPHEKDTAFPEPAVSPGFGRNNTGDSMLYCSDIYADWPADWFDGIGSCLLWIPNHRRFPIFAVDDLG